MIDTDSYLLLEEIIARGEPAVSPLDVLAEVQAAVWLLADQHGVRRDDVHQMAAQYLALRQERQDDDNEHNRRLPG